MPADPNAAEQDLAWMLMSMAPDPIVWVGPDGRFLYANHAACKHFGCSRVELAKMSFPDIDPTISREEWPKLWKRGETEGVLQFESVNRTRDDRLVPVDLTIKHTTLHGRSIACAFIRDMTERKRLEEKFPQAQKLEAVGRLAGASRTISTTISR